MPAHTHSRPATAKQVVSATEAIRRGLAAFEPCGQITVPLIAAAFAAVEGMHEDGTTHGPQEQSRGANLGPELASALADYRAVLQQWNAQLPRIQGWLLAEKARLETCLGHAASVRTWLEANRRMSGSTPSADSKNQGSLDDRQRHRFRAEC